MAIPVYAINNPYILLQTVNTNPSSSPAPKLNETVFRIDIFFEHRQVRNLGDGYKKVYETACHYIRLMKKNTSCTIGTWSKSRHRNHISISRNSTTW